MQTSANASSIYTATWPSSIGNSEVYVVDSMTGASTLLGLAGTTISGLTFSGSTLYGWGQNGSLYTVNQTTGAASLVGASGELGVEGGIAAHPSDGFFYAGNSAGSCDCLVRIDPGTGAGVVVGGFGGSGGDISGLTFIGSTLYGYDAVTDALVTVNLTTGVATQVGNMGINALSTGGLAYDGSQLFLLQQIGGLYSIDIGTGAATLVTAFSGGLNGEPIGGAAAMASTTPPTRASEPGALLLFGLGLAGLGLVARRRRQAA